LISPTPAQPAARKDRSWIILAGLAFLAVLSVMVVVYSCWFLGQIARARLRRLPSNRITLLLHSRDLRATLCTLHRDVFGNHPFAGNPGISRTQGQVPPVWVSVVLVLLFGWFGVDGLNSFAQFFPNFSGIYEPTNLLRLITGMGVGLGIGSVLYVLFNGTAWSNWVDESVYQNGTYFRCCWLFQCC